jgi:hypothetical protein
LAAWRAVKPKLFVDTQICIDVTKRLVDERLWARVWRYITGSFEYVISPLTLCELLHGVAAGTDIYFNQNRKAIRVLVPPHRVKRFLDFPGAFVLKTVLHRKIEVQRIEPEEFDTWVKLVLKARSKAELEWGGVRLGCSSARRYGFDFRLHIAQHLDGHQVHVDQLKQLRNGDLQVPSRFAWAAGILARQGLRPSDEDCRRVAESLDAAFHFDMALFKRAKTSNYNFEKHATDWIDEQQLYYLSDPQVHFLTRDGRLQEWVKQSTQAKRILDFSALKV